MIFWLFFNSFFTFFFFQAQQRRPLPIGAGTIRQPNENDNNTPNLLQTAPSPSGGISTPTLTPGVAGAAAPPSNRHKNVAWIENQIRKDQHEAVNPKYKLPFKSKDDAIKRLLRYKWLIFFWQKTDFYAMFIWYFYNLWAGLSQISETSKHL